MEKIRLGDVCEILNGFAFKSENYSDSGVRVIRITNVQKGFIEDNTPAFYPLDSRVLDKYMLEEGDLLMSLTGNVGRVAIIEQEFLPAALNQRVACLRLKTDRISKGYLFHILNSDFFEQQCIQSSKGVAQKNMSTEWLKDYEISLYPKEKQKEITEILDRVRNVIACRNQELRKLDDLVRARFIELFGDVTSNPNRYPVKNFEEISVLITDGEHATPRRTEEGIYLLSARNVLNHALQLEDVDYIDDEEYSRIARRVIPQAGDVLISCSGSIGRCCVVPKELRFQMVRSVALIRFDSTINPVFAEWLIASDDLQQQIAQAATQSSQANLFQGKIRKLHGYVPPIELQEHFAAFVQRIAKSKAAVQKALDQAQLLFDSLMQEYFG